MATEINKDTNDAVGGSSNTGVAKLTPDNQGRIKQICIMPVGYQFATRTAAMTLATRKALFKTVKANRHYLLPVASNVVDKSTEPSMFNSPLKGERMVDEGKIGFQLEMIDDNEVVLKKLRTFKNYTCRATFWDENKNEIACTPDGTKVQGFKCSIYVSPRKVATTAGEPPKYMVTVTLEDITEWADNKVILKQAKQTTPILAMDLPTIYDVELTQVGTPTTTECKLSVNIDAFETTDADGQIVGLVKADFVWKTSAGVVKTLSSCTDNGDGTYTFVPTNPAVFATGDTIDLVACASISLTNIDIESKGAIVLPTIS